MLKSMLSVSKPFAFISNLRLATAANDANWKARVQLAAAYRALDSYGMNEGVCNHLTLMAPARDGSDQTVMLLIPHGLHWSQVKASSLIALNDKNEVVEGEGTAELAAKTIHRPIHNARRDANAVFHLHSPYSTALGCLEDQTIKMCHQDSQRFYGNTVYDSRYDGFSQALSEGERLAEILGDKSVMMMGNHGILVAAPTVARAFDTAYYLERACMFQILAESTGRKLRLIPDQLAKKMYEDGEAVMETYAEAHFNAMVNVLRAKCPDFET